jgi:hypothetical protein
MQLVAYGAQDVYLTGNPQITFWKVTYRRYTNFATESIEQTFNGQADFGRRVTCTISRNGDLAYRTYLQVTLPKIQTSANTSAEVASGAAASAARWLDYPGEQIISCVEVEIGGQRIDRQYGDWMHIWNQLTITASQEEGYNKMVGNTTELTYLATCCGQPVETICDTSASVCGTGCVHRDALPTSTLYVPLQFWYCKNPGLAIPLIALQYHEVKIVLEMNYLENMLWAVSSTADDTAPVQIGGGKSGYFKQATGVYSNTCLVCASLYVDYVFLDTDERRRMAQNPHEYLIEQLQFTGDQSIGSSSNKIQLNFNHPCKELIWVVQPACNVDYCGQFQPFTQQNMLLGAQPFNYTDQLDGLPRSSLNYRLDLASPANNGANWGKGGNLACIGPYCGTAQYKVYGKSFAADGSVVPDGAPAEDAFPAPPQANLGPAGCFNVDAHAIPAQQPHVNNSGIQVGFSNADAANAARGGVDCDSCSLANCPSLHCSPARAIAAVVTESSRSQNCWGNNPVVCAKLLLNGQDRFSERLGSYFDLVQPFQHHTSTPATGINVYSFALRPEEHQPSGTCNFSRIDNASIQMVVSANTVRAGGMANVRVYATNYNVLRIMSGMGGLAYSN